MGILKAVCFQRDTKSAQSYDDRTDGAAPYLRAVIEEVVDDIYNYKLNRFMIDPVNAPLPPGFDHLMDPSHDKWKDQKTLMATLCKEVEEVLHADPGYRTRVPDKNADPAPNPKDPTTIKPKMN